MLKNVLAVVATTVLVTPLMAQSFSEGFDTGLPAAAPQGFPGVTIPLSSGNWFALNESTPLGSTGVFAGNTTVFNAHAGPAASYAAMNFNSGSGLATISTFFMSPTVTFNNGDTISFFTRTVTSPAFPDRLLLRLSQNGASTTTSDFSTVLLTVNPGLTTAGYPNDWAQFSATLSGLSGPTLGRFAFHYSMPNAGPSGANSDFIGIDTVSYLAAVPEPTTWALMGLAVAGAGIVWRRRNRLAQAQDNVSLSRAKRIA